MAEPSTWFLELFRNRQITAAQRVQWANDLLALGPHGTWVEAEPWAIAMTGTRVRDEAFPVYDAGSTVVDHDIVYRVILGALYLHGSIEADSYLPWTTMDQISKTEFFASEHAYVFDPLWARSGDALYETLRDPFSAAMNSDGLVWEKLHEELLENWIDPSRTIELYRASMQRCYVQGNVTEWWRTVGAWSLDLYLEDEDTYTEYLRLHAQVRADSFRRDVMNRGSRER